MRVLFPSLTTLIAALTLLSGITFSTSASAQSVAISKTASGGLDEKSDVGICRHVEKPREIATGICDLSTETASEAGGGLNLYQYGMWNPVRFTDPDGRSATSAVAGAAEGGALCGPWCAVVGGIAGGLFGVAVVEGVKRGIDRGIDWYFDEPTVMNERVKNAPQPTTANPPDTAKPSGPEDPNDKLKEQLRKSIDSWKQRLSEHEKKLEEYRKDPDKFDNKDLLKNAPNDAVRQKINDGRIRHLTNEIKNFKQQIEDALKALGDGQ